MLNEKRVLEFLDTVDQDYPVPLSQKVDLREYARKLIECADLFVDLEDERIEALVAGYARNAQDGMGYIAIVGTRSEVRGQGKAGKLVRQFAELCRQEGLRGVHLYTAASNASAMRLYQKLGFAPYVLSNESRPEDCHLVYWIHDEEGKE